MRVRPGRPGKVAPGGSTASIRPQKAAGPTRRLRAAEEEMTQKRTNSNKQSLWGTDVLGGYFFAAEFLAAQRFFRAATIAARPSALSFRFDFFATLPSDDSPFAAAHRFRCASAIAFLPAALIVLLPEFAGGEFTAAFAEAPVRMSRSSAICTSRRRFCS